MGCGNGQSEEGIQGAVMLATFVPNNWVLALAGFLTLPLAFMLQGMCLLL